MGIIYNASDYKPVKSSKPFSPKKHAELHKKPCSACGEKTNAIPKHVVKTLQDNEIVKKFHYNLIRQLESCHRRKKQENLDQVRYHQSYY